MLIIKNSQSLEMTQMALCDKSIGREQPRLDSSKVNTNEINKPRQCIVNAFNKILREINLQKKVKERPVINLEELKHLQVSKEKDLGENQLCETGQLSKEISPIKRPSEEAALENFYIQISFTDLQQLQENQLTNFVQKREKINKTNELASHHFKGYKASKKCQDQESSIAQPLAQQKKQPILLSPNELNQKGTVKKSTKRSKYSLQDDSEDFMINKYMIQNKSIPEDDQRQQHQVGNKRISKKTGKNKIQENVQRPQLYQVIPVIMILNDQSIETEIITLKDGKLGKKSTKFQSKQKINLPCQSSLCQRQISQAQSKGLKKANFMIQIQDCKDQVQSKKLSRLSKQSEHKEVNSIMKQPQHGQPTQKNKIDYKPYLIAQNKEINQRKNSPFLLGNATLSQLVQQLFTKKLINSTHFYQFQENHSNSHIHNYLQKFDAGKLHQYCFNKIKFTPLDHRRISELLYNLYPQQYRMSEIKSNDAKLLQFLVSLYDLEPEDYYHLWMCIDKISNIKWWSKILITQDQKLMQYNKEKRVARRRAEQAAAAVQTIMESVQLLQNASLQNISHPKRTIAQVYQIDEELDKQAKSQQYEQQRQRIAGKQKELNEISKIRNMVSNFNTGSKEDNISDMRESRKKVKFV